MSQMNAFLPPCLFFLRIFYSSNRNEAGMDRNPEKREDVERKRFRKYLLNINFIQKAKQTSSLYCIHKQKQEEEPLCSDYTWALEANTLPFYDLDQLFNLFKSDLYNKLLFLAFKTLFI